MIQGNCEQHEDRMARLTKVLDFFSQVLSIEQLTLYGFTFLQDILSLQDSALYMKRDHGRYEVCNCTGCDVTIPFYQDQGKLDTLATLLGRALWKDFDLYFDREFVESWQMGIVIPIILQDQLMGFVVSKGIKAENQSLIDEGFVESIKNVMNMAFYMAVTYEKSKEMSCEINKRVFNLSFVNQSTKVLLSELNIETLYQLCIDVVRELTSSDKTGFCLYDEIRDCIMVKSYNDILTFKKKYVEFKMKTRTPKTSRMVYNVQLHKNELTELIENIDDLELLGAKYVILLVKDEIIGFITVGEPVNQIPYDEDLLAQIESVASSIFISITNAMFIRQIQLQNEIIEQQLKTMNQLNRTVKNINSCQSIDEISEIILTTLEISHGVRHAFVASRLSTSDFKIVGAIGADDLVGQVFSNHELHEKCRSNYYFDYSTEGSSDTLPWRLLSKMDRKGCFVVSPLKLDILEAVGDGVVGYVVITASERSFKQEDLCAIETMSCSAAPIIKHMQLYTELEHRLKPDDRVLFWEALQESLMDQEEYQVDFRVYYKKIEHDPFKSPNLEKYKPYNYFAFDGYLYVIARLEDSVDISLFDASAEGHWAQSLTGDLIGDATA